MQVDIVVAGADQKPVLANLLELYSHDFSEITELHLDSNGRFGYAHLPLYWQESNRHPFLIMVEGRIAGFVLVRKGSQVSNDESIWDMTEFFVMRGLRRHRIGMKAAHQVWRKFPERWEIRVTEKNQAAEVFWSRAISSFTGITVDASKIKIDGKDWHLFCFDAGSGKSD